MKMPIVVVALLAMTILLSGCKGTEDCMAYYSASNSVIASYLKLEESVRDEDDATFAAAATKVEKELERLSKVESSSDAVMVGLANRYSERVQEHVPPLVAHLKNERSRLLEDANERLEWPKSTDGTSHRETLDMLMKQDQQCE